MNVIDLIEILKNCPQDCEVRLHAGTLDLYGIKRVYKYEDIYYGGKKSTIIVIQPTDYSD